MTDREEREMVGSELLHMLEDVANREIPCQVAYADIQKRLATARLKGRAESEERWQRYTKAYLKEGIERRSADFARGKACGVEETKSLVSRSVIDASDALLALIDAQIAADPVLQSRCQQVMEDAVASIKRMAKAQRNMERIHLANALSVPIPKLEEL